jgi:hypothetical protein
MLRMFSETKGEAVMWLAYVALYGGGIGGTLFAFLFQYGRDRWRWFEGKYGDGDLSWIQIVVLAMPITILTAVTSLRAWHLISFIFTSPKTGGMIFWQVVSASITLYFWISIYGGSIKNKPKHHTVYTIWGHIVERIVPPGFQPRLRMFPFRLNWLKPEQTTRQSFDKVFKELPATSGETDKVTGEPILDGTMSAKGSVKYSPNHKSAEKYCQYLYNEAVDGKAREGMEDSLEDHLREGMRLAVAKADWEKVLAADPRVTAEIELDVLEWLVDEEVTLGEIFTKKEMRGIGFDENFTVGKVLGQVRKDRIAAEAAEAKQKERRETGISITPEEAKKASEEAGIRRNNERLLSKMLSAGIPDCHQLGILIHSITFSEARGERGLGDAIGMRGKERLEGEAEELQNQRFVAMVKEAKEQLDLDGDKAVDAVQVERNKVTKRIIDIQGSGKDNAMVIVSDDGGPGGGASNKKAAATASGAAMKRFLSGQQKGN